MAVSGSWGVGGANVPSLLAATTTGLPKTNAGIYPGEVRSHASMLAWQRNRRKTEACMSERLTLLPCPFCGGEPASYWIEGPHHNSRNNPDYFRIACCVTIEARTAIKAAGKWNRRAAPVAGDSVRVPKDE